MRRYTTAILTLVTILTGVSCNKLEKLRQEEQNVIAETLEKFVMTKSLTVDVPDGMIAVVKMKDTNDTIAVLPMTASIMVPCSYSSAQTKALDDPTYTIDLISPKEDKFSSNRFIYDTYFTLAFEDSRKGDYDYNDVVLNICLDNRAREIKKSYTLGDFTGKLIVNPIAFGATKTIGFGINIGEKDILLTDDIRRDFFDGEEGFINTGKWQKEIKKFGNKTIYSQEEWLGDLYFFIEVEGQRFYAVNAVNNDKMLDDNRCPYGIIISNVVGNDGSVFGKMTDQEKAAIRDHMSNSSDVIMKARTWWRYPYEGVSLDEAYYINCKKSYKGWFDFILQRKESMTNVCYFNRADEKQVFPSIGFKEDGSLDVENTIYYNKFLE